MTIDSGRDLLDYIGLFLEFGTFLVTTLGLGFVVLSLNQSTRQQRIEEGPYVRIDIGLSEGIEDQRTVPVYYEDSSQVLDLRWNRDDPGLEISAWFRNYQKHPLGFALGVTGTFIVEVPAGDEADESSAHVIDVEIPYLEFGKCVKVHLASLPSSRESAALLSSLSFYDLYDHRHQHIYGQRSTNALHGRLYWLHTADGTTESTPEGRSRGTGVDYNVGEV